MYILPLTLWSPEFLHLGILFPIGDTMEQTEFNTVDYSAALVALKDRKKIARLGWAGKGLYVQRHGAVRATDVQLEDGLTPYIEPFFVIVDTKTGKVNTWVPSVSDLQATDWVIVQ